MPKETFFNLSEQKRNDFINETLLEFSKYNFETASINRIIQNLGIARGSVYQYFDDKLDLWLYIKDYAENVKMEYIKSVKRDNFPSFWDYYRELFVRGVDFDIEKPLCSQFLYRVGFKESSNEVKPYLDSWKEKANRVFSQWIETEKKLGSFNKDLSTEIIVHFLITSTMSISELLQQKYKVDFENNLRENKPLFGLNKAEIVSAANDLINLFEKSLK
jgi:AcrR family transcriptional regulator